MGFPWSPVTYHLSPVTRHVSRVTLFIAALLAPAVTVFAEEEKILNVYNWADYIGPDTLADFEAEYGIRVNYDLFDSTTVVEAKLMAGQTGYDVVLQASRYSARMIPQGVFLPLDKNKLPLRKNLDPWVMSYLDRFDPGNRYSTPYMWGTTGFIYNVRMIRERMPDAPVHSSAMLFDPEVSSRFADCGISLLEEPTTVIPMVLLFLGHDPNSMDPVQIAEAESQLKAVRPYLRYVSSAKLLNDLPNEDICIAMGWSGDYGQASARIAEVGVDVELAYTVPEEGTVLWFDSLVIPADAPHPENAHLFLNYLMRPEVIAPISELTGYANANLASIPYMDPALANDPVAYPSMEDRNGWEAVVIHDPKLERMRSRAWSRFKTGL